MNLEMLQNARLMASYGGPPAQSNHLDISLSGTGLPCMTGSSMMPRPMLDQTMLDQSAAGFQLSQSAMLVGTVAALQEESGHLRNQYRSDVSRLESEMAQLRSAAAWALPQLAETRQNQNEPSLRLMQHGAALERSSSLGNIGGVRGGQLEVAMMQGALNDRLKRESGLDTLLAHGAMGDNGIAGSLFSQASTHREAAIVQGALNEQLARQQALENLMRQGAFVERGSTGGLGILAQEAAQLEAAMSRSDARDRVTQMQRNASTDNIQDVPRLSDAVSVMNQRCAPANDQASVASRSNVSVVQEQQAARETAEKTKTQMLELYRELEKMTFLVQEAQQENSKLKDDKETNETAHARDIATLEEMIQSLSAENQRLTKNLAVAEAQIQKRSDGGLSNMMMTPKQDNGGYCSGSTSTRSASNEPASEPAEVERADIDRIAFRVGISGHR